MATMKVSPLSRAGVALPARASRTSVRVMAAKKGEKAALASIASLALVSAPAKADVQVDSAVESVIGAVKATGEVVKSTITTIDSGVKVLKEGYDVAAPVVERAVKVAAPVVEQAVKVTADAAGPVLKAALPTLEGTVKDAGKVLESTGIAPSDVTKTASSAASTVTPFITKFFQFLASSDPLTLGEYALGTVALVYLAPPLLGGLANSFKGYAGELAPAAALDLLVNDSSAVLVDVRTPKEKEASGIPDLPSGASARVLEVEYAVTEDKKLRSQLRDPAAIEAQVTALQIAALKKINKGSKVVLLDRYGPAARIVAKELGRKGYGKVYVIGGGFDGRGGWVQSKLQIKPAVVFAAAAPPSIAKTVFTRGAKALPAPKSS